MIENGVPRRSPSAKPNEWRLQFSLRALLGMVLALSLASFIGFLKLDEKRRERAFAAEVLSTGGLVWYDWERHSSDPPGPLWMRRAFGENLRTEVKSVSFFQNRAIDDARFLALDFPRRIDSLDLTSTHLTDKALEQLYERLPALEDLSLGNAEITDAGMTHIMQLKELRTLSLGLTRITDAGVVRLCGLSHLVALDLEGTAVTDVGLLELERVTTLQSLDIYNCNVSLHGVRRFETAVPGCNVTWLKIRSRQEFDAWNRGGDEALLEFRRTHGPTDDRRAIPILIKTN
jgi:hypothetical protein